MKGLSSLEFENAQRLYDDCIGELWLTLPGSRMSIWWEEPETEWHFPDNTLMQYLGVSTASVGLGHVMVLYQFLALGKGPAIRVYSTRNPWGLLTPYGWPDDKE